jgi:hypothetical protein
MVFVYLYLGCNPLCMDYIEANLGRTYVLNETTFLMVQLKSAVVAENNSLSAYLKILRNLRMLFFLLRPLPLARTLVNSSTWPLHGVARRGMKVASSPSGGNSPALHPRQAWVVSGCVFKASQFDI